MASQHCSKVGLFNGFADFCQKRNRLIGKNELILNSFNGYIFFSHSTVFSEYLALVIYSLFRRKKKDMVNNGKEIYLCCQFIHNAVYCMSKKS